MFSFRRDGVDDVKAEERRRVVTRTRHRRTFVFSEAQDRVQVNQLCRDGQRMFVVEESKISVSEDTPLWLKRSLQPRIKEEDAAVIFRSRFCGLDRVRGRREQVDRPRLISSSPKKTNFKDNLKKYLKENIRFLLNY